jgi:hypothetical protein
MIYPAVLGASAERRVPLRERRSWGEGEGRSERERERMGVRGACCNRISAEMITTIFSINLTHTGLKTSIFHD